MPYNYTYNAGRRGKNHSSEDPDEAKFPLMEMMEKKPYKMYEQVLGSQHTHFYISKAVGEPDGYTDMVHRILTAGPNDVIYIHLNTPGGQLDTGVQIVNAMQNSQAKVVTVLESTAYSLGTLIFLAGDEMVVNEHCMMMFHNFNGGLVGKGNELVSELEATVKWFSTLAQDIYIPFLTQDEFDRIARGEDMWMQSPEIKERLERMVKILQKKQAEEAKREEAEMRAQFEALMQPAPKKTRPAAKKTGSRRGRPRKEPLTE